MSCIVKGYGLDENFLDLLDKSREYPGQKSMEFIELKVKKALDCPPFCLLSEQEYRLAMVIAGRLQNPYLQYAHTPEEMLLSATLYETNPSLRSEELRRYDFAALLLCQFAKEELTDLNKQLGSLDGTVSQGKEREP